VPGAPLVGDLRSARQPDAGILSQLSNPLFVHAGGIDPVISLLQASALQDENLYSGNRGSAIIMQPGRESPYSTFVNTASLWAFVPADVTPRRRSSSSRRRPHRLGAGLRGSVHIPFSSSSDVTWTWSPSTGTYLRSYAGTPDTLLTGGQTAAKNVVVLTVQTAYGSWVENEEGGHEVLVTSTGTGPLVVLRDGVAITGTWSRTSLTAPTTFTATDGTPITLSPETPGRSWCRPASPSPPPVGAAGGSGADHHGRRVGPPGGARGTGSFDRRGRRPCDNASGAARAGGRPPGSGGRDGRRPGGGGRTGRPRPSTATPR